MHWMQCPSTEVSRRGMQAWAKQTPGAWFQAEEISRLEEVLPTLFGYHLLQVGDFYPTSFLDQSRIPHVMLMDEWLVEKAPESQHGSPIVGSPEALPIATDSLDVVVLPHTLEFTGDPHQILREADRILIPEGHVVILGFNPWSLWMLWRLILGWRGKPPWCGRFLSQTRLQDWLQLLGFDIVHAQRYFFRPPLGSEGMMRRLGFLERLGSRWWPVFGAGYILVAKKRVVTMTPIRPRWQARRRLAAADLLGNSNRTMPETAHQIRREPIDGAR